MDQGGSEEAPGDDDSRLVTGTLLPLRELCHLYILGNLHRYSPDYLGLLPPTLRRQVLVRLPAVDLHALEGTPVARGIDVNATWASFFDRPWLKGVTKNDASGETDRKKVLFAEIHKSIINGGVIPYHSVNPHCFRKFCHETSYLLELTTSTLLTHYSHSLPIDPNRTTNTYSHDFLTSYGLHLVCGRCLVVRPARFDTNMPTDHVKSFSCAFLPFPINSNTYQLMHILRHSFQFYPEELEFFFHSVPTRELSIDLFGYQVVVNYYSKIRRLSMLCSNKVPCSSEIDDHYITKLLSEISRHPSPSLRHLTIELAPSFDLSEKFLLSIYPYLTGVWLKGVPRDSECGQAIALESLNITCSINAAVSKIIGGMISHQPSLSYLALSNNKTEHKAGLVLEPQSSLGTSLMKAVETVRYLQLVSVPLPSNVYGAILTLHFLSTHSHSSLHLSHASIGQYALSSNVILHANSHKTLSLNHCQAKGPILDNFSRINFGTLKLVESSVPGWSSDNILSCLSANKDRLSMRVLELQGFSPDHDPLPPSLFQCELVSAMLSKPFLTELTLSFYDYQNAGEFEPLAQALERHAHTLTALSILTFHDCYFGSRPDTSSSLSMLLNMALQILKLSPSFSLRVLNCTVTRDSKSTHFLRSMENFCNSWQNLPNTKQFQLLVIPEAYFNILKTTGEGRNSYTTLIQMAQQFVHDTEYLKQMQHKNGGAPF